MSTARNDEMRRMIADGASLDEVASRYRVSRQRVSQIVGSVADHRVSLAQVRARANARLREQIERYMQEYPEATIADICAEFDITRTKWNALRVKTRARTTRDPAPVYSDEQVFDALRRAADDEGRVSKVRYDAVRDDPGEPSGILIAQRFGTWNAAIRAAGLTPFEAAFPAGKYMKWPADAVADVLAQFLSDPTLTRSVESYDLWRRGRNAPSGVTAINRFGSWGAAIRAGAERMRETRQSERA